MDGNKDEARKCVRIGKEAMEAGDRARALKFLAKARRLNPTLAIDDLLSSAGGGHASAAEDARDASPPPSDAPASEPEKAGGKSVSSSSANLRARVRSSEESSIGPSADYTEEQIEVVRQIKKKKDYYEILGLERSSTVEDVRKAYRKLSLKVHPDKNKAPGAEEAFKAVSKSFQCLSNEESRKMYDISGSDDPAPLRKNRHSHGHGFNGFYDTDIDADEIFRNFFGGMHPETTFGTFHFRTGGMGGNGGHGVQGSGNLNFRALLQILPIIILLLVNFLPSSDPVYTFNRSYPYLHKVLTSKGVPFYVKSAKFEQDYPYQSSERIALETGIDREYVSLLAQNCRIELQRQQWGFQHQKPHCDMYEKFQEAEAA